jgi:hypothetical protein
MKKTTTLIITLTLIITITLLTTTTHAIKLTNTYKNQLCTDQPTECKPTKNQTTQQKNTNNQTNNNKKTTPNNNQTKTNKKKQTPNTTQNNQTNQNNTNQRQEPTKKNQNNTPQQPQQNQPTTCTDTDNGINPNQQGTTTTNNQTQTDTCTNNNQLTEYHCTTQEATPTKYQINPTTKNIQIQYQGQPNTTYQIQTTTNLTNWTTQTTITTNQQGTATYEDPTTQQNPHKFYKATTTTINQTTINCPNGCQNGQCNPQPYCPGYQTIYQTTNKKNTTTQNTPTPTNNQNTNQTQQTPQNPNTYTGYLEIWTTTNNQTQYKLKTKNNTYTLTLNPNQLPPNITTTQRNITIKATPNPNKPNHLTVHQITTNQTKTKNQNQTNYTKGPKHLAIIITKPPNTPNPNTTNLNQTMNQVKKYYEENSYNQTTITWETLGPYEIDNTTYNQGEQAIITTLDPHINYTKYWSIIIADPRTKPANATLGQAPYNTNEGEITIGIVNITPEHINNPNRIDTITHELGHNYGLGHAGYWDCQEQPIKNDPECTPIEYYNYIDTMGGSYHTGHFNAYFKEKLNWLNNNQIQEITQDGEYTLYPYEQTNNNPIALKIPRKWNNNQQPTDYYYLEYRTPTGYNKDSIETYQINGPTITIPGNQPHTRDDAHLISMNPQTYPYNPEIEPGKTFQDTTNLTITTLETTPTHTKIKIHINKNACTRNPPTITINPTTITLRTNPQAPPKTYDWETGYIDLTIKNNDTQGCSNKYLYANSPIIYNQTTGIGRLTYNGTPTIPTTPNGTPYIRAQDTIYNNIVAQFVKPDETETTTTITIYDEQGNTIHQQPITIKRTQLPTPHWPNQDMAIKFTYNATGDGKYILDKTGKIHRTGKTLYATENTPNLTNSTPKDLKTIGDYPNSKIGTAIIFDSKNQIHTAGFYSGKYDLQFANPPTTPHYCDITQALEITTLKTINGNYPKIILMDEYGNTTTTNGQPIPNSQNWKCQNWQGKTNAIRQTPHATDLEITTNPDGTINGYYILSKDGTIYACGNAPIEYTKLTPQPQFTQNQQATAIALQPNTGIIMIDNYGKTYTSGQTKNLGHPNLTKPNAKDIKFKPNYTGYGILDAEGNIYEYNN